MGIWKINLLFFVFFLDYRKIIANWNLSLIKPCSEYRLIMVWVSRSFGGEGQFQFSGWRRRSWSDYSRLGMMCLSNWYTDSKNRCILVVRDPKNQGHSSNKQLKNKQEQVEQALNCKIKMKVLIWKHEMVGFRIQSDGWFIQHASWNAVAISNSMKQNQKSSGGSRSLKQGQLEECWGSC
jgi:hypothetical protein